MISALAHDLLPASATLPSDRQRLFMLFFAGALVDLAVLGLFAEHASKVHVASFTTALLAAALLQILLKLTMVAEHRVLARFKDKTGAAWTGLKFFTAWLILFGSKFVILEALSFVFGDRLRFEGAFHGIVWLIIVVVTMVIVEELIARLYRKLA
jgi:membrane protease YdiL (CAAX protease family)